MKPKGWIYSLAFSCILLSGYAAPAQLQTGDQTKCVYRAVEFTAHPNAATEQRIRGGMDASLKVLIKETSMYDDPDFDPKKIVLEFGIVKSDGQSQIYAVRWSPRIFGHNAAIWVIEVTPNGVRDLIGASQSAYAIETNQVVTNQYPEIVFLSSGFPEQGGGGRVAVYNCFEYKDGLYRSGTCRTECEKAMDEGDRDGIGERTRSAQ